MQRALLVVVIAVVVDADNVVLVTETGTGQRVVANVNGKAGREGRRRERTTLTYLNGQVQVNKLSRFGIIYNYIYINCMLITLNLTECKSCAIQLVLFSAACPRV